MKRKLTLGAAGFVAVLILSWWWGCWRDWRRENPPPPPIPGGIDEGQKVDAPEAPKKEIVVETRVAELTPDQVGAWLKKYGLVATKVPVRAAEAQAAPTAGGFVPGSVATAQPEAVVEYPIRLSEETFCQAPEIDKETGEVKLDKDGKVICPKTSPSIDVTAFQACPGCDVEQRGVWREYQPEPCPEAKVFAAPGRFRKFVGVGGIGGSVEDDQGQRVTFADPAALAGLTFEGVRAGPVTLGGMGLAGVTMSGDVAAAGGIGISF